MIRANNSAAMKKENRRHILRLIRQGGISRASLSRSTGLSRAAVSIIADGLISEGLIMEGEAVTTANGRHPTLLNIKKDALFGVGVDISREGIFTGVCDFLGEIIKNDRIPFENTAELTVKHLKDKIAEYFKEYGNICGIGISAPGPLKSKEGIILNPTELDIFHNFHITECLSESFFVPVTLEKDTDALALAEKNATNTDNFLFLLADHGLGAGFIKNGELFKGFNGFGCEIGHISIDINGPLCSCGMHGCAGLYASVPAIVKRAGAKDYASVSEQDLMYQGQMLGRVLVSVINLLEPETVVLGGELVRGADVLCPSISRFLKEKTITRGEHAVIIRASPLKTMPRLTAAAALSLENIFKGDKP